MPLKINTAEASESYTGSLPQIPLRKLSTNGVVPSVEAIPIHPGGDDQRLRWLADLGNP
jgi:hypothetical protein